MKDKTKDKINDIARLVFNSSASSYKMELNHDFSVSYKYSAQASAWNMALIAYVECFPEHRDLLRFKI